MRAYRRQSISAMNVYKKFTGDVGVLVIANLLARLKPIIFLPIITKALGASDYGVYTTLLITITFFLYASGWGLDSSLMRFFPAEKDKKKVSTGVWSILLFILVTSSAIAVVASFFADQLAATVFGDPGSAEVIRIGVFILPLEAMLGLLCTYLRMRQKILLFSVINLSAVFGTIALAAFFLLQGLGLIYVIYATAIVHFALVVVALLLVTREIGFSRPQIGRLPPYLKFGAPLLFATLSSTILGVGDRYVIGIMLGSAAVGVYAVAYNMGNLILMAMHPITFALLAPLAKAYDEGMMTQVRTYLKYSLRYFLMIAIPATVGLLILSGSLIRSLTTDEFTSGSAGITAVVAVSNIAYGLYVLTIQILYLQKRSKLISMLLVPTAFANIALNVLLIPVLGIMGSALATMISFFALLAASLYFALPHIRISLDWAFTGKCIASAAVMGLLLSLISPQGSLKLALTALLGVAIYFGLLFAMRAFKKNELRFFKSFIRKQEESALFEEV